MFSSLEKSLFHVLFVKIEGPKNESLQQLDFYISYFIFID